MADQLTASASAHVDAPADEVFAFVCRPANHAEISGDQSVKGDRHGPDVLTGEGDTFGMSMKMFGLPYRITNTVVEFDENRLIAWRHFGGHRWRYELEPTDDGGTTVTETFDYSRYPDLGARILRLTGTLDRNRRGIEQTLVRLKQAAESDAAA